MGSNKTRSNLQTPKKFKQPQTSANSPQTPCTPSQAHKRTPLDTPEGSSSLLEYTPSKPRPNRPIVSPISLSYVLREDFLKPHIRKMVPAEGLERADGPINAYTREKRNFSELSATNSESSSKHKISKSEEEQTYEVDIKSKVQLINQKLKMMDAAFEANQAFLRELRKSWAEGSSDITIGQLEKQMKCLEKEIGDLLVAKVALRTSTYSLAGSEMDFERWNKESHANDWSYLDLICSRFTEPSTSTVTLKKHRDVNQQSRWRNSVLKAYGADKEKSDSTLHWCPIAGGWVIRDLITVAHIVRHNVTELAAEHLFGLAETKAGHIWSVKNGMPMLKCYEKMLDDASIVIIPTNDGKDLMVRVLDTNVSNKFGDTLTKEEGEDKNEEIIVASKKGLDGRILKFRTDFRPAKRYLYFGFAINILRRQRYESDGWWRDRVHFASTPFFSTPGKWVNETTLKKLAVRVGHLTPDEAENFGAMARDGKRGNEDPFLDQPQPEEDDYEEVQTCTIQRAYRQR